MSESTPAIEAEGVTYAYDGIPAVEDVSLVVASGSFVGLLGPNGSGKTTLLKLLLGLLRPDSGTVRLFGEPAAEFGDGTRLGYVAQHAAHGTHAMPITVREVVAMGRIPHRGHGRLTNEDHQRVEDALDTVGIADIAHRRISRLSGGQRQRAYIARALAGDADLLALDEPAVGVDARTRDRFFDLLDTVNERGITIVLIEHDIGVITEHVETVYCLNRTLYRHGPPDAVLDDETLATLYGAPPRRPSTPHHGT